MASEITVDYDELEGLEEGCNERGPYARKPYRVAWNDRFQFIYDMRGLSSTTGLTAPWSVQIPYQYPPSPNLYAMDCVIEPVGDIVVGQPLEYTDARIWVTFGCPPFNWQATDDPLFLNSLSQDPVENSSLLFASQELRFGTEWYEVPNSSIKWKSDNAKINTPTRRNYAVHRMIITWHRYPLLPFTTIRNYADSVNASTFLGCDKGTVYLEGVDTVRERSSDGTMVQKVRMQLKWRQFDWNKKVREDGFTWDTVVDSASGNELLPYKDYSKLLL